MTTLVSIDGDEPISLEEAKDHCYVTSNDSDIENTLESLISVAREYAEGQTWRQLVEATYKLHLDEFPKGEIVIPKPPTLSVEEITYYDGNGEQDLDEEAYRVDTASEPARIEPVGSWPGTEKRLNAVTVKFTAGYTDKMPEKIRQAMLLLIKHWFDNREAVVVNTGQSVSAEEVPLTATKLLEMESVRVFA